MSFLIHYNMFFPIYSFFKFWGKSSYILVNALNDNDTSKHTLEHYIVHQSLKKYDFILGSRRLLEIKFYTLHLYKYKSY